MEKNKKVVVFGSSLNPPGFHHLAIVQELTKQFDKVIVVPCGMRPDKLNINWVDPVHRAVMADKVFSKIKKVRVDLFDLERDEYARTWELAEKYKLEFGDDVWIMAGTDLIKGGKNGQSQIQREWERGPEIWKNLKFAVFQRMGHEVDREDLPPHRDVFSAGAGGSSTEIRKAIANGESIGKIAPPEVVDYIERYNLYRGRPSAGFTNLSLEEPRLIIATDGSNPMNRKIVSRFSGFVDNENPNLILVVGGDGTMIRAVRDHWKRRLPFFGINTGHRGFLLNDIEGGIQNLIIYQLPMLRSRIKSPKGDWKESYAINDVWLEREDGQAAWIAVDVNGQNRLPKLIADGVLVATPAGSTAYAKAMGASPLLIGASALVLVGSNVIEPQWKSAFVPLNSQIKFTNLSLIDRPVKGYIDGVCQGIAAEMEISVSQAASVELAFIPGHDLTAKLSRIQFGSE